MIEGLREGETSLEVGAAPAVLTAPTAAQAGLAEPKASPIKRASMKPATPESTERQPQNRGSKAVAPGSATRASSIPGAALADRHSYTSVDRAFKAHLGRLTFGLSPAVLAEQSFDWLVHLAISPGKQLQLIESWLRG